MTPTRLHSRHLLLALTLAASAAGATGCHRRADDPNVRREIQPITRLRVENRNYLDHNIYVLRGAERIRIGTATGSTTTVLRIPANLLFGGTQLRFMADPVGARGTPVSEEVTVHAGDEIGLTIPP